LGGYDSDNYASDADIQLFDLSSTDYWEIPLTAANLGSSQSFLVGGTTALIGPGSPFIMMPYDDFNAISEMVEAATSHIIC